MDTVKNIKEETGMFVIELKKPFNYEGKEYSQLEFDFTTLKGSDMVDVEEELVNRGIYITDPEFSTRSLMTLAAKAGEYSSDLIEHLPVTEYLAIRKAARNFIRDLA